MPTKAQMVKTTQRRTAQRQVIEDDKTEDTRDGAAADAAVAEVVDPKGTISFSFGDRIYTYKRKRVEAVQFRLALQKREDAAAIEWLLGVAQFAQFLDENTDDDGCTSAEIYEKFVEAIFEGLGTGN